MHELLVRVLEQRDLSKAGELFKVRDWDIVNELDKALAQLKLIFCSSTYLNDQNNQSVVEICLARITSAIRETKTIEIYAPGLVDMLEACLTHKMQSETPHAKIASDLLSCLFLHYGNKSVMTVAIPVAVKALKRGNRDLVRNTSSYLALAAIHNAKLLAQYSLPIIESITQGNYSLVRVLPQIYGENRDSILAHLSCLIGVLDECDLAEKLSLLQMCSMIANTRPELLVPYVGKLRGCLSSASTCSAVLHIFLSFITSGLTHALCEHLSALKQTADVQSPSNVATVAKVIAAIARSRKAYTQECVSYLVVQCYKADSSTLPILMKEIESISEVHPEYVQPFLPEIQKLAEESNNANARNVQKRIMDYCSDDEATRVRIRTPSSSERITVIPVNDYCSHESLSSQRLVTISNPPNGFRNKLMNNEPATVMVTHGHTPTTPTGMVTHGHTPTAPTGMVTHGHTPTPTTPTGMVTNGHTPTTSTGMVIHGHTPTTPTGMVTHGHTPTTPTGMVTHGHIPTTPTGMAKFVVTGKNLNNGSGSSMNSNLSRPKSRSQGNLSTSKRQLTTITINKDLLRPPPSPKVHNINGIAKPKAETTALFPGSNDVLVNGEVNGNFLRRPQIRMGQSPSTRRQHVNLAAMHQRNSLFVLGSAAGEYQVQYMNTKGRIRVNPPKSANVPDSPMSSREPKLTGSHVVTTFYPNRSITQRTGSGSTLTVEQSASLDPRGTVNELIYVPTKDAQTQSSATLESRTARDSTNMHGSILQQLQMQEFKGNTSKGGDAIKQFCEKHKQKIKLFASDFCTRYPIPTQCTVEESGHKQRIRVHFNCQERSEHCLYTNGSFFAFKTKQSHIWLHLMFLHLQAQSIATLDKNNEQVRQLKCCWDNVLQSITKNQSFIALVTSAFPALKDQEQLLKELQVSRYFDLFAFNAATNTWACFPCNHPDKVQNFIKLNPNNALIEGQLKEKKGRWKLFKRWQTRYFTLSGASLSYREDQYQSHNPIIDLRSIKSVKSVSKRKGRRTLPKAFEIFTEDDVTSYVLKAKDRKNAEEWFQCLQIAIAQAHKEPQVSAL